MAEPTPNVLDYADSRPGGPVTVTSRDRVSDRGARGLLLRPAVIDLAIATFAVLLIASPLLFTSDGFAPDFTNAIWLAGYQQHLIAAHLHPTLFLQTQTVHAETGMGGVFYPFFAFYGGTLFAITGALAVVLGGATILAFTVVTLAGIAAAYGGLFWLARQLGARGVLAHAPALVFVTSAYYVTNLYGRGAWAEFMAVSALPLVLAATLALVRGRRRAGPVVCLVAATVVFSGSHNITLLWGSTLTAAALACCWLLSGRSRALPWRRMVGVAGLIALGVGLNGWFLLPDISYAHNTLVSTHLKPWSETGYLNTFGVIFDPLRTVPSASTSPALYVQTPVLALAWGLLAIPLAWREGRSLRAGIASALILLGGLLVVMMSSGAWSLLPALFRQAQFAYRLQTYVTLACAGLVMVGAVALSRRAESGRATGRDREFVLGLGLVLALGLALSTWQLWVPTTHIYGLTGGAGSYVNRAEALRAPVTVLPSSWNAGHEYADHSLPVLTATEKFTFQPTAVNDDRLVGWRGSFESPSAAGSFPTGDQPFVTNIVGGPYLVDVRGGVRVAGVTSDGDLVLKRITAGSQPARVELSARPSVPVILGWITTAMAAAILLAIAVVAGARRRREKPASGL